MRYLMRLFYTLIQNGQGCFGVGAKMARSKTLHAIKSRVVEELKSFQVLWFPYDQSSSDNAQSSFVLHAAYHISGKPFR